MALSCNDRKRSATRTAAGAVCAVALTASLATTVAFAADGSGGVGTGGTGDGSETSDGEFPVRGKHTYGDGMGAGRGHQGQDLLTKCGKPVVAAQPGRVQLRDYDGAAGNYAVIDGKGKLKDTVYMHMAQRALVRKGERVSAGDLIGRVGTTGRSTACHLHFEIWDGSGYYEGGSPINPKPSLRRWDRDR
jgi:murein DD-endopeptidase MepM/ murein hydrolase activator NlpD